MIISLFTYIKVSDIKIGFKTNNIFKFFIVTKFISQTEKEGFS